MKRVFRYAYWRWRGVRERYVEPFATTLWHRLYGRRKIRTMPGYRKPGSKVAIYLIYPKWTVQPSHIGSMAYLAEKGFSVIVVSNLALSPNDIDLLRPHSTSIIERPNIGYDFGGYQDGVRSIRSCRDALDQLILVNDSTWFPLAGSRDWIEDVSALGVDFAGAASNLGLAPLTPEEFRSFEWSYETGRPQFHYCSYALSFGNKILRDGAFWSFWDRFQITNDKIQTVRRGEVGLSQLLIGRGHSHGCTLAMDDLGSYVASLSDERLGQLVRALIIPQERELSVAKAAFLAHEPASAEWRGDAVRFILNAIARTGISYALPELTVRELGFPFLKKSPLFLDSEGCRETLRILKMQPNPIGTELLAEARHMMGTDEPERKRLVSTKAA